MFIVMATVMNYKDEDIEMLDDNCSQNNGELLKARQVNFIRDCLYISNVWLK